MSDDLSTVYSTEPGSVSKRHTFLVQAPIAPIDRDGVWAGVAGTVLFAVLVIIQLTRKASLNASSEGWWLWVGVAGFVIGLIGTTYCLYRRTRKR